MLLPYLITRMLILWPSFLNLRGKRIRKEIGVIKVSASRIINDVNIIIEHGARVSVVLIGERVLQWDRK